MSAFRRAVLSVAPERLEQFTIEMKKNINEKSDRKRHSKKESSADKSSSNSKSRKRRKRSSYDSDSKKPSSSSKTESSKKTAERRKSGDRKRERSRSKERTRRHKSTSGKKEDTEKHKKAKDDSDFDPKDLDLSVPLLPLSDMAKDRKVMLETAFSIIKGPKLTSMLPDILKLTPIDEIKQLCEEQLGVMSSKRIHHVLAGTEMHSSSGTDSSDDDGPSRKKDNLPKPKKSTSQESSLQTNLVDSTTSDHHHPAPSMLFPSAVSTARTSAKEALQSSIPARKIDDAVDDEDNVSTSTEPNFIYTDDVDQVEPESSSDTEEGEVQTSEEELDDAEEQDAGSPDVEVEDHPPLRESPDIEESEDMLDVHPADEVLVEVEEIEEEHEEVHVKVMDPEDEDAAHNPSLAQRGSDDFPTTVQTMDTDVPQNKTTENPEPKAADAKTQRTVSEPSTGGVSDNPPSGRSGKTQLEILELELRARAIKSLMKAAKAGIQNKK